MSPEQPAGTKSLTVATDVYSLGAILFERICGKPLYDVESDDVVVNKVRFGARPNFRLLTGKTDEDLGAIIRKCLEFRPEDRYENCRDLRRDLELWMHGEPLQSQSIRPWQRGIRWARRHPLKLTGAMTVLLAVFSIIALAIVNSQNRWRYRITEYARNVQIIRAELSEQSPGWKERAYHAIDSAARIAQSAENKLELASLKANCDIGFDLHKPIFRIEMSSVISLKFHPQLPLLLVARRYSETATAGCPLLIIDTRTGEVLHELMIHDSNSIDPTGIKEFVVLPDEGKLVVLTTKANLHVYRFADLASNRPEIIVPGPTLKFLHMIAIDGTNDLVICGRTIDTHKWLMHKVNTTTWKTDKVRELPEDFTSMVVGEKGQFIFCDSKLQVVHHSSLQNMSADVEVEISGPIAYHSGRVVMISPQGIGLYDIRDPAKIMMLQSPPGGFASSQQDSPVQFSADGALVAAGDKQRTQVHIWSTTDGSYLQSVPVIASSWGEITLAFSRDNLIAISGGSDVKVLPVRQSSINRIFPSSGPVARINSLRNSNELFVFARRSAATARVDLFRFLPNKDSISPTHRILIDGFPEYASPFSCLSPDGSRLAVAVSEGNFAMRLQIYDTKSLAKIATTPVLENLRAVCFDYTGNLIVSSLEGVHSFKRDHSTLDRKWSRKLPNENLQKEAPYSMIHPVDEKHLIVGDTDGWVYLLAWSNEPNLVQATQISQSPLRASAVHPSANIIAIGDGEGTIYILSTTDGQVLGR